jgi:hypothetical protein
MAKKEVALSVAEYDKVIDKYEKLLNELYNEMKSFNSDFQSLLKGDNEGPYWNGSSAVKVYQKAKINADKNLEAYDALCTVYNSLKEARAKLAAK